MNPTRQAYINLHIAVLLFGFTAILGDLILLPAVVLVWWRVFITSISLLFLIQFGRNLHLLPKKLIGQYMGIGVIVGIHWITFFGAVKYSNASVCLVCMATTSFFTAILEPIILKQKIKKVEILLGLLIIPGMALIVRSLDFSMWTGVALGLTSALLAALFSIFNKKLVDQADPMSITFLELGSAWLSISLILPLYFYQNPETAFWPQQMDWVYLLILALLCTTLAYVLSLRALKYISAFASNLTVNLEPVYGIILAAVLLKENEELTEGFYWGCSIILLAVFCYPLLNRNKEKPLKA